MTSLAQQILESRRDEIAPGRPSSPPRPDVLLIGPAAVPFVLRLADSVLRGAPPAVRAIAWWDGPVLGPAPGDDEGRELFECAARLGTPLLTPVAGACEPAFREALAAPGRLVASCAIEATACGALCACVWRVSSLEAAALLCGAELSPPDPGAARLVLRGSLPPGVGGIDVALEFARHADLSGWVGRSIDVSGPGVAALGLGDRIALARALASHGAEFALLPSDDVTRAALRAWGRDADWREIAATESPGEPRFEIDLDALEPLVAPAAEPALARPLRHALDHPLRAVALGPYADDD